MEELLNKWKSRRATFRSKAEEAMFGSLSTDPEEAYTSGCNMHHWETCVRQWDHAIEELEEALHKQAGEDFKQWGQDWIDDTRNGIDPLPNQTEKRYSAEEMKKYED